MFGYLSRKNPLVRQFDPIDCGPASLLSILRYYGGNSSLAAVRRLCQSDSDGTTMWGLVQGARQLGFFAMGATGTYDQLKKEKMPCIAHVIPESGLNHFVVVYRITPKHVFLADPAKGRIRLSRTKFENIWAKKAVILLQPDGELIKTESKSWLKWLYGYLATQQTWIFQSLFLGIVYSVLGLSTSLFIHWLIDRFIPAGNIVHIVVSCLLLLFFLSLRAGAGYIRGRFLVSLNKRVNLAVTGDFLNHLFHLPKQFFNTHKTGDIIARINDSIKIHQAVLFFTTSTYIDGLIILTTLGFMFYFSTEVALMTGLCVVVFAVYLGKNAGPIKERQNKVLKSHAAVESAYIDSIHGIEDVIGYGAHGYFFRLNHSLIRDFQDKIENLGLFKTRLSFFTEFLGALFIVCIITVSAVSVVQEKMLAGQLVAVFSLFGYAVSAIVRLLSGYISIQEAHMAANRLMDILEVEKELKTGGQSFPMRRKLIIKKATFQYNNQKPLFSGLDMVLEKGTFYTLWGPSGVGKTTLAHILQRKLMLKEGQIFIDNIPVTQINLAEYRHHIAVVEQKSSIYNGTVADNILVGRLEYADRLQQRISELGLGNIIHMFDHGLATLLGEQGRILSGGECQLVGLARALIAQPDVLIIDEGFNAIDVQIRESIFHHLKKYARRNAVLFITHDLETILRSDYLYILGQSGIIESGDPSLLIECPQSCFAKIFRNNMSAFHLKSLAVSA
ncbi:peptidase domain-containing ABC transporter [candidate division KSB1 bacterium]|nr:peptidase domain-containing ABC transporter [candidate division KSB1 bacterium]